MNFVKWLDERTGLVAAYSKFVNMQAPGGRFCCRAIPVSLVFLFILQALTGIFLWAFYSPSATSAWESVFYIQYVLPFGWLVRGIHHYSAQVFVALSGLYVFFLIIHGAYRRPREFVYWSALVMFLLSLCSCLTGDLLPWSLSGYFATFTRVAFLQLIPGIGVKLYQLVVGGPDPQFGSLTLTRFLFLHVCVFGGGGFVTLCLWKYFDFRSRKILRNEARFDNVHKCCLACANKKTKPFWACDAFLVGLTCVVTMAIVLGLVFQRSCCSEKIAARDPSLPAEAYLGAELTGPVDVSTSFDAARPEWSFRGLYTMSKLPIFSKIGMVYAIFVVPPILVLLFFLAPIIGSSKFGHVVCVVATLAFAVVVVDFSYKSYYEDYSPKSDHSASFKAGMAEAERAANRAVELAFAPAGIPKTGALTLLKDDPYLQGPALFNQHCASCHNFKAQSEELRSSDYVEIECSEPTAPNLYGAHSAEWIRGFTNENTLADVDCFGATAFATDGSMIKFMKDNVFGGKIVVDKDDDGNDVQKFMLSPSGLIGKVIDVDGSAAVDVLESVFEDFCGEEENLELINTILNEDGDVEEAAVDQAKVQLIAKLKELLAAKFADEEFVAELDPQVPAPLLAALQSTLMKTLDDGAYQDLLFDETALESIRDEDYEDFISEEYLARLNGNEEPIPLDELQYIDELRDGVRAACDGVAEILAEEAKLDAPRPFVDGAYLGLAPNAISDLDFLNCTNCHSFYGTENDHACDLRAYMSRNWLVEFISDPTLPKFYGAKNDRMPSYHPAEGDALMTQKEVEALADWLSGKWYRAPEVANKTLLGEPGAAKAASVAQEELRQQEEAVALAERLELDAKIARQTAERLEAEAKAAQAKEEKIKKAEEEKAKKEAEEKAKLQKDLADAQAALKKTTEAASNAATEASETLQATQKERDAALQELKTLKSDLDKVSSDAADVQKTMESEKQAIEQNVSQLKKQIADQSAAHKAELEKSVADLNESHRQAMQLQKEAAEQRLAAVQNDAQTARDAEAAALKREQDLKTALQRSQSTIDQLNARIAELEAEISKASEQ